MQVVAPDAGHPDPRQAHLPRRRQRQRPVLAGCDAPGRGPGRVVRLRRAQRRVRRRAQAPLFPGRGQLDHRAGQRARRPLPGASRVVRRRLFVGGPAPHGQAVACARQRRPPGRAGRPAVHRHPSRSGLDVEDVAEGQAALQHRRHRPRARAGSVHAVRLAAGVVRRLFRSGTLHAPPALQEQPRHVASTTGSTGWAGCRSRWRPRPPCSRSTSSGASVWRTSA